jgi:hypothetical protein
LTLSQLRRMRFVRFGRTARHIARPLIGQPRRTLRRTLRGRFGRTVRRIARPLIGQPRRMIGQPRRTLRGRSFRKSGLRHVGRVVDVDHVNHVGVQYVAVEVSTNSLVLVDGGVTVAVPLALG